MMIKFPPALNAEENELYSFAATPMTLQARGWKEIKIACPVSADLNSKKTVPFQLTSAVESESKIHLYSETNTPKISFILHGDSNKMAVINGFVLKEGNSFDGWRVLHIEQKRVQIGNNKEQKWISID